MTLIACQLYIVNTFNIKKTVHDIAYIQGHSGTLIPWTLTHEHIPRTLERMNLKDIVAEGNRAKNLAEKPFLREALEMHGWNVRQTSLWMRCPQTSLRVVLKRHPDIRADIKRGLALRRQHGKRS